MRVNTLIITVCLSIAVASLAFMVFFKTPVKNRPKAVQPSQSEHIFLTLNWPQGQLYSEPLLNNTYSQNGKDVSPAKPQSPQSILNHLGSVGWKVVHENDSGEILMMRQLTETDK